ncbi:hypothetical protein P376_0160 [Streptomyces sp. HCCB10043]|nr:hypothetical protein P376_0160 [Streptomyces sp. HCCB10043]
MGPCQVGEGLVESGGHGEFDAVSGGGGDSGAWAVGGQREFCGGPCEAGAPVGELGGEFAGLVVLRAQHLPLPERVVGVLHGQRFPVGCPPGRPRPVGLGHVACERSHGPAVPGDVVQDDDQYMFLVADAEQCGAEGDLRRQVEGPAYELGDEGTQGRPVGPGHGEQRAEAGRGQHDLVGTVPVLLEHGAQRLVAFGDVGECGAHGGAVQGATQAECDGHVVRGAVAVEPVEEPQAALGVRQRDPCGARSGGERGAGLRGPVEGGGQGGDRAVLEEGADVEFGFQVRTDTADEFAGQQRVPAGVEEVVVGAERGKPEHVGVQAAEDLLDGCAGALGAGRGTEGGLRQGAAVQFAVGGEREGVEENESRGHHVRGQPGGEVPGEFPRVDGCAGDDVRHEASLSGGGAVQEDDVLGDGGVAGQGELDLGGFDAEAAEFDLIVHASEVFDHAAGTAPDEVAGAVHAFARRAEGAGHEAFGRQAGPAGVAAGELGAGEVELAGDAFGYGTQEAVEDVGGRVVEGVADDGAGCDADRAGEGVDGEFGGAVVVVRGDAGDVGEPGPEFRVDAFTAEHEGGGVVAALVEDSGLYELLGEGGGDVDDVDALPVDEFGDAFGVSAGVVVNKVQFVAGGQADQTFPGGVEGEGGGEAGLEP